MTDLTVNFYNMDYSDRASNSALKLEVKSIVRDQEGGDKEAKIKVVGAEIDLWELTDYLRLPARIYQFGAPIFRGFVKAVTIRASNGLRVTISLANMANKIKVQYSNIDPGESNPSGESETSWYENTGSSGYYGTKEKLIRLSEGSSTQAIAYANRAIYDYAYPMAEKDLGSLGNAQTPEAEITLAGWFETLDWMIYTQEAGHEGYEDIGDGLQAYGDAAATTKLAQSFQLGSSVAWTAGSVKVRVKKEGSPTDNLTVELCSDSSGVPGTVLASATLAGASVPENLNWQELTLSAKVSLALSTTYWLVVRRSGATDGTNYYKADANEALGYSRGALKIWNGSAWVARGTDADLLFVILGTTETTTQIGQIVTSCGQFLTATMINTVSGVYSSPYRDGTQSGLAVIRELLKSGTTNYRRLQASVDDERRVTISEEPAMGTGNYGIDADGNLYDAYGNLMIKEQFPAGVWLELKELVPIQAQFLGVRNPTTVFVESVTWQAGGKMSWRFRGSQILTISGID
jgi:hypothetical protein